MSSIISSGLSAVVLGLSSAAAWGAGDFCGGLAAKRTSTYTVVALSQFVSLVLLIIFALLMPEGNLTPWDMILGGLAGFFGALSLVILYTGLARGPMGVVAPVTAVVAAIVPVIFSMFIEGFPGGIRFLGFGIALIAVWLISQVGKEFQFRFRDLGLPVAAGIGFGLYFILIDQVSQNAVLWPLVAARSVSITLTLILAVIIRKLERPMSGQIPIIALAGIFDTGGNVFFALASRVGRLDISAILSSLYPAMTVFLAWIILKERLTTRQWIGISLVLLAVLLITI
jgi:drug/metabolite transporter (DMT)-like permease